LTTLTRICICSPCYQPWALTALMLADAPWPRGSDADLSIAGYVVGALYTGRCLPAIAPRVLIMGDEVRSRFISPDSHFNRFQFAASRITRKSYGPRVPNRTMVAK